MVSQTLIEDKFIQKYRGEAGRSIAYLHREGSSPPTLFGKFGIAAYISFYLTSDPGICMLMTH